MRPSNWPSFSKPSSANSSANLGPLVTANGEIDLQLCLQGLTCEGCGGAAEITATFRTAHHGVVWTGCFECFARGVLSQNRRTSKSVPATTLDPSQQRSYEAVISDLVDGIHALQVALVNPTSGEDVEALMQATHTLLNTPRTF